MDDSATGSKIKGGPGSKNPDLGDTANKADTIKVQQRDSSKPEGYATLYQQLGCKGI